MAMGDSHVAGLETSTMPRYICATEDYERSAATVLLMEETRTPQLVTAAFSNPIARKRSAILFPLAAPIDRVLLDSCYPVIPATSPVNLSLQL